MPQLFSLHFLAPENTSWIGTAEKKETEELQQEMNGSGSFLHWD